MTAGLQADTRVLVEHFRAWRDAAGVEPLAIWDTRDPGGLYWTRWREAGEWAQQHIADAFSTYRAEFYLVDAPFAVLYRYKRNDAGPQGTPVLWLSPRRRLCGRCNRKVRVTIYSPGTAFINGFAGLSGGGQCCTRCTRLLRSPDGAPPLP